MDLMLVSLVCSKLSETLNHQFLYYFQIANKLMEGYLRILLSLFSSIRIYLIFLLGQSTFHNRDQIERANQPLHKQGGKRSHCYKKKTKIAQILNSPLMLISTAHWRPEAAENCHQ
jgi:hypothetical protein